MANPFSQALCPNSVTAPVLLWGPALPERNLHGNFLLGDMGWTNGLAPRFKGA